MTKVRVTVTILVVVWLFPLYWMLVTALSAPGVVAAGRQPVLPEAPTLQGVRTAVGEFPFLTWVGNSAAIAVVAVAANLVMSLLAGYALAKRRFPGRAAVSVFVLATLTVPAEVLLIPQFDLVASIGWVNSFWAVIVPRAADAFGVLLARQYMLSIPDEVIDAARVDGAGELRVLLEIVLPVCRPVIAVIVTVSFMYRWNEFAWPLTALPDPDRATLTVGLSFLQGQYATDYPTLMSGAVLSVLPVLVLFVAAQRAFVSGLGAQR
ncbi:carbohydrate ABC transporter permease [Actinomycetospora sp. CA-084318]|uniref:carbohydrate ABC transporter permease n=1 Tax=Actinomycetospora sp. CA-084318 TaxID=3239892 RepID=UPI003D976A6B